MSVEEKHPVVTTYKTLITHKHKRTCQSAAETNEMPLLCGFTFRIHELTFFLKKLYVQFKEKALEALLNVSSGRTTTRKKSIFITYGPGIGRVRLDAITI